MAAEEKSVAVSEGEKKNLVKPEKPNEDEHKAALVKATKEWDDAKTKEVSKQEIQWAMRVLVELRGNLQRHGLTFGVESNLGQN